MASDEEEWTINEKRTSLESVEVSSDQEALNSGEDSTSLSRNVRTANRTPIVASSSFDPYNPENDKRDIAKQSLIDEADDLSESEPFVSPVKNWRTPGVAGFLEMEEEPSREIHSQVATPSPYSPLKTSSGLLLTHRKGNPSASTSKNRDRYDDVEEKKKLSSGSSSFAPLRSPGIRRAALQSVEVENPWSVKEDPFQAQIMRMLSYTRLGVLLSAVALIVGSSTILHHWTSGTGKASGSSPNNMDQQALSLDEDSGDQIILVPMSADQQQQLDQQHRHLLDMRSEFDEWVLAYGKVYADEFERERRYQVWLNNHMRTIEKNEKHGPCRMTKQPVFGSNHFKDLTPEEFKQGFLTGYSGPTHEEFKRRKTASSGVLGPHIKPNHHPEIRRRMQSSWKGPLRGKYQYKCKWYDASCNLQYVYDRYFYGFGTTMEPAYDANSYPKSIDWRDSGAVSEVRSQGNCGACWAITAVETVESAVFLNSGSLYDLSETEVIICTSGSEMCYGGWPQDAFEYVMENKGVPLEDDMPYDGDFLLALSDTAQGSGGQYSESYLNSYQASVCPNAQGSHDSKSNDANEEGAYYDFTTNDFSRYGQIEGYGYATDRCACYTDGSGCDCDSQDESMAVRNVATYGPATVCVDASLWQDYAGGIITSSSGCSEKFMDVNHCIQVVGYAFTDGVDDSLNDEGEQNSHDGGSRDSKDDSSNRQGYWIVKNQWGMYWGYSGYAYVAMGENTCGILNDMVQVYA